MNNTYVRPSVGLDAFHCLHCGVYAHQFWHRVSAWNQEQGFDITVDGLQITSCTRCKQYTVWFNNQVVYPKAAQRKAPPEVPSQYADEFNEACSVLVDSPKASAALGRRTLQRVLHEHFHIDKNNLAAEINALLADSLVPSYIADDIHHLRKIGNFAAHPIKNEHTGEIVDVEPDEAVWLLDVLEALLDFCFVQPERARQRREATNLKLAATRPQPE